MPSALARQCGNCATPLRLLLHLSALLACCAPAQSTQLGPGPAVLLPTSKCTAHSIGCYSDCLGFAAGSVPNAAWPSHSRTLAIGVAGCCAIVQDPPGGCNDAPTACLNGGNKAKCPSLPSPTCDSKTLTATGCADLCAQMGFSFAGVEGGAQCYCGNEISSAAKKDGSTPFGPAACNSPCAGMPGEMCGGSCALDIYTVDCGSKWGWIFLASMVGGTIAYTLIGVRDTMMLQAHCLMVLL